MTLGGVFVVGLHMLSAGTTPVRQRLKKRDSRCSPFFLGNFMMENMCHNRLTEVLLYEPETGRFFWRTSGKGRRVGVQAGRVMRKGYRQISVDYKQYLEHRLAWFYIYKEWPRYQIDHINEVKTDNRIANLRDVLQTTNLLNQSKPQKNNTSGFRGVSFDDSNGKYRAQLMISKKQHHLGYFDTAENAYKAYLLAKVGV